MRRTFPALLLSALLVPSAARAGVVLGARLGAAVPGGDIDAGEKMTDLVDWAIPLQLDVGYRFTQLEAGLYLRYAPAKIDGSLECAAGATCRASDIGFGVQADLRLLPGPASPWVGGFLGYDVLRYDAAYGANEGSVTTSGLEVGAQGGLDFALGALSLGPYGAVGVGRYGKSTLELNGSKDTQSISDQRAHVWIQLGIRGAFAF